MSALVGFSSRLRNLLEQGRLDEARVLSRALTPELLSEELRHLSPRGGLALCSILKPFRLAALMKLLSRRERQRLLSGAALSELRGLFLSLPEDMLPELLSSLPSRLGRQLVEKLPPHLKNLLAKKSPWAHDTVGYVMSNDGVTLSPKDTVAAALEKIRRDAPGKDRVYRCIVIDGERFVGTAALEDIVLARPDTTIDQLTEEDCHSVTPESDRAEAARIMSRYDVQVLPVVKEGRLLGILPFDDVLDVMEDENTELFHHVGGLYAPNSKGGLAGEIARRFPCLLLCLVTGILTTGIMENYEAMLSQVVALSFFVPDIYTAIAFDSGGVASGPMTATFMLQFVMGASSALGGNILRDAFGVVALVAMMPLLSSQAVGFLYERRAKRAAVAPEHYGDFDIVELWEDAA